MTKTITHNGVEWPLDYFVKITDNLIDRIGENPSEAKQKRLDDRLETLQKYLEETGEMPSLPENARQDPEADQREETPAEIPTGEKSAKPKKKKKIRP